MKIQPKRFFYVGLVFVLLASAVMLRYIDPYFVSALRLIAFDYYQRLDPAKYDPDLPVRVVDIDEASLERFGQWPWPRTTISDLLLRLAEKQAAAVAFDILFSEADRTSLEEIIKRLPEKQASVLKTFASEQLSNDQVFAQALKETPSVLAVSLGTAPNQNFKAKAGFANAGDDPRPFLLAFPGVSTNLEVLNDAARGIGAFNWTPERDQVVRRVALVFRLGDTLVPALAMEALRVAQNATTYVLKASNASGETAFGQSTGLNNVRIGEIQIPTDGAGAVFLKFRPFNKATYIPVWKVMNGEVPSEDVAGRIILVGTSAPGLLDLRATPLDAAIPGVEVHAQLLERMLTGNFLSRPDYTLALEQFVLVALGLILAVLLPRVSARTSAVIGILTMGLVFIGGWVAYRYADLLIDPSYPALSVGCIATVITSYVYQTVEAQRGQIRHAFGRYLAPTIVEEIIAHPEKLELGGEERELTLMFCDVRNFTGISQQLTASELTLFINELLTPLTEIILAHRGTIDKYMGDAIMAFWNAPIDDGDHVLHATQAALGMAKKLDELNTYWKETERLSRHTNDPVRIGIGINTGLCCVGNLGSNLRFDYSAIGDEVNVTSRLEGLSKLYGVTTVLSQRSVPNGIAALELDLVQVKGRSQATKIYTLLDTLSIDSMELKVFCQQYESFLAAYRQQSWDEAERALARCRSAGITSFETCFSLFTERIAALRKTPLSPNWDGAFALSEK